MGIGVELFFLYFKLALESSLLLESMSNNVYSSPKPCQKPWGHPSWCLICVWSHSRCLCIVFLLFSPRLHSWSCEIFKLTALWKLCNLIWYLERKSVWERIPLWRAAYLYMAQASEMDFWTSCENDSSWYNGQLSELIRISDNLILLSKLR